MCRFCSRFPGTILATALLMQKFSREFHSMELGREELLQWISSLTSQQVDSLESLRSGALFLQVVAQHDPVRNDATAVLSRWFAVRCQRRGWMKRGSYHNQPPSAR